MGALLYGTPATSHEIDDRALAHLQIVIINKFRRDEAFALRIDGSSALGTGRRALWLHPSIPVQFTFRGSRTPAINPAWVRALMEEAPHALAARVCRADLTASDQVYRQVGPAACVTLARWAQFPVPGKAIMGRLYYDSSFEADFDDRVLAHLQIVIGSKLARDESFYFSWKDAQSVGDGRTSIWMHPAIPLRFKYHGSRPPAINPTWIRQLLADSHTAAGLRISDEPDRDDTA